MLEKIHQTVDYIKKQIGDFEPEVGIILGTGLGRLAEEIDKKYVLSYEKIPNFPVSTVEGHSGNLIFGTLSGKRVMAMQGRFHFYEGYSMKEVTFPVRVMKFMNIKLLIVSNASGGVNPAFDVGDVMIINDHINLFPEHPLRGKNYDELGPRFPDMSEVYKKEYIDLALKIGEELGINLRQGVYVGVQGPTFETPAEYRYMRIIGGDAVGMSTVPEIIVARHMNIPVFAISVITDSGAPEKLKEVSHEEVQKAAQEAEPKMTKVIKEFLKRVNI